MFGFDSLLAPVVGAVAGKVLGGKGEKSTATQSIQMPDNVKRGYDALIEGAMKQYETPRTAPYKTRVEAPTNAFDALFTSPELLQIQRMKDADMYAKSIEPQPAPAPVAPKVYGAKDRAALLTKVFGQNPSGNVFNQFMMKGTDVDYAAIDDALSGANQVASGWVKNGNLVDLGSIVNKYARG